MKTGTPGAMLVRTTRAYVGFFFRDWIVLFIIQSRCGLKRETESG